MGLPFLRALTGLICCLNLVTCKQSNSRVKMQPLANQTFLGISQCLESSYGQHILDRCIPDYDCSLLVSGEDQVLQFTNQGKQFVFAQTTPDDFSGVSH